MLDFTLLGRVTLSQNGEPLTGFRSPKEAALLIYLAHTGEAQPREFLADLLWDNRTSKQSLSNLRTVLSRLRKTVGEDLAITRKTVALAPAVAHRVDSADLLTRLRAVTEVDSADAAHRLQQTLDAYRGAFLNDFTLDGAPRYDAWITTTREQIRRAVIAGLHKLGQYALSNGDAAHVIRIARQWLTHDPLDGAAHTLLLQGMIAQGHTSAAIAHYRQAAELFNDELGVAVPAQMTALIGRLRSRATPPAPEARAVRHNLPAAYDKFIGRDAVQTEIHARLDQPWCRLVTIAGQGGAGKTRLATRIARSRLRNYPDGVWLADLTEIDPDDPDLTEAIAIEIATVIGLRLTGSATPVEQLLAHLQPKRLLLVLDNFEHVLAGVPIVTAIIERCEQVQMIATSRELLRLRAEWAIDLAGLRYAGVEGGGQVTEAMELFIARQAQRRRDPLAAENLTAIRAICGLTEGLPLAIELAAAMTRHMPVRVVADRLHGGFDLLATTLRDVPVRHRSLHMVFEMSWQTLAPTLQRRLARLSYFHGGFTAEAARRVADADASHLAALRDKSLLRYDSDTGRYTLHAVVHDFAVARLPGDDPTPLRHTAYYLDSLAQQTEPLQADAPQRALAAIAPEIDNARTAWRDGLATGRPQLLLDALKAFSIYFQLGGFAHEGVALMRATVSAAAGWGAAGLRLATRAGLEQARFENRLGHHQLALQTVKAALRRADQGDDRWAQAMGRVWQGESLWRLGKYDAARETLHDALSRAGALASLFIVGWCHHHLGIIDEIQSRYAAAHDHLVQACAAWEALNNVNMQAVSLNSLALVLWHRGDRDPAQTMMERALTLCQQAANRHLEAYLLSNLGIVSGERGDYPGAHYYLQLALDLATHNGNRATQGDAHINIARVYQDQGEIAAALHHLERGLHLAEQVGKRPAIASALTVLAELRRAQGDAPQAEANYERALAIAREDSLPNIACEALLGLAALHRDAQVYSARHHIEQARALAQAMRNPQLLARIQAFESELVAD